MLKVHTSNFGMNPALRCSTKKGQYHVEPHIHQFSEIVYVMKGTLKAKIDDVDYNINPGEIAVITPFQMHEFCSEESVEFYMCVFSNNCVPNYHVDIDFFHNRECAVFKASQSLKASSSI